MYLDIPETGLTGITGESGSGKSTIASLLMRRRALSPEVCALFPDFKVFVGGSSSFDMAPAPFDKAYALSRLCGARGLAKDEVLYVGDDYGPGGNDESVLLAGFPFLRIDDYRTTPAALRSRLLPAGA